MEQNTFEIMYQALVEIATANTFFDESKKLSQIAKQALQNIGKGEETTK
ncbi:hypothetical protein [Anabaena azotica]|uniref:CpcA n=1 Tax=Anabaena azotica FACHB-119 TaxID=947527 RepID=A0ABR8CY57_9NOST|nr:hypothetical protein [Anabaena azotica]MBD2499845.1 hypothetical protein [Anabaena azotica FACHB-119]